jgi:hypothetical protein
MRINLLELAKIIDKTELKKELKFLNKKYSFNLTLDLWDNYVEEMTPIKSGQVELFA